MSFPDTRADVSVSVVTLIFRAYLIDQTMDHLSATLKRGGVKDLLGFFPPNKRDTKSLDEHFKKEGLPQVAEWWAKKQYAVVKESIVKDLQELCEREETPDQVRLHAPLVAHLAPMPVPDTTDHCLHQK